MPGAIKRNQGAIKQSPANRRDKRIVLVQPDKYDNKDTVCQVLSRDPEEVTITAWQRKALGIR